MYIPTAVQVSFDLVEGFQRIEVDDHSLGKHIDEIIQALGLGFLYSCRWPPLPYRKCSFVG